MSRRMFSYCVLSFLSVSVLLFGCNGHGESPTGTNLATGDTDHPDFLMGKLVLTEMEQYPHTFLVAAMSIVGNVSDQPSLSVSMRLPIHRGFAGVQADTMVFEFHSGSMYWYSYYASTSDTADVRFVDSIQFLHGDEAVQWPDSSLWTGLNVGNYVMLLIPDIDIIGWQTTSISGDIPSLGDVVVHGSGSNAVQGLDPSRICEVATEMEWTISNLAVNLSALGTPDGCWPESGRLQYAGYVYRNCNGTRPYRWDGNWSITQSFRDQFTDVTLENANHRWTFTDTCQNYTSPALTGLGTPFANGR